MNAVRIKGVVYVSSNIIGFEIIDNHVTKKSFIVLYLTSPMNNDHKVSIELEDKEYQMLVYKQLMGLYQFPQMNEKGVDNDNV